MESTGRSQAQTGEKDRFTTLLASVVPLLQNHLRTVRTLHEGDLAQGHGGVYLPYALELLGHNDVATTMIYTHVLQQGGQGVPSPLDDL